MEAPGASASDIERGVAAAQAVFTKHNTTPKEAAWLCWERERRDVMGDRDAGDMTDAEHNAADAWYEAHTVAIAACYQSAKPSPEAQIKLAGIKRYRIVPAPLA